MSDKVISWWTEDRDHVAEAVVSYVESLEQQQSWVQYCNKLNERLYSNRDPTTGSQYAYSDLLGYDLPSSSENVLAAVCDTATALIAASRPRATFQTTNGDWSAQLAAKDLQQWMLGAFRELEVYPKAALMVRHGTVFGTGAMKTFALAGRPQAECVPIDDVIVDEQEARNCPPRQVHHRRFVDKGVLAKLYPKFEKQIGEADPTYGLARRGRAKNAHANSVPVIESWRLPTLPQAKDGRRTVCIRNACLEYEDYESDSFPLHFFRWQPPLKGFYGVGICELLAQLQLQLNEQNQFIRDCQRLIIAPRVYGDFGAKVPVEALTNEIGLYVNTRGGKPPTFYTPTALNAESYNERTRTIQQMFAIAGVSEMVSRARKEPGIDSGVAIREMADQQSGRFALPSQAYEDTILSVAKGLMNVAREVASDKKPLKFTYRDRSLARTIDWAEVSRDEDDYVMSIEAASLLGATPAGRLSKALDLLKAGAIDASEFRHLIDHPDVDRTLQEQDAPRKDIEAVIEQLTRGEWDEPDPFMDLVLGVQLVQRASRDVYRRKAPEKVMDLFRRWVDVAGAILEQAKGAPQGGPPPMAGPGGPTMPGAAGPELVQPIAPPPPLPGIAS
jgi:hypothetical protein